jgi:hypothetical protein
MRGIKIRHHGTSIDAALDDLTPGDWADARALISSLAQDAFTGKPDRNVFFARDTGWAVPFPNLRACWSRQHRAVVFYGVGLGAHFETWACAHARTVLPLLRRNDDRIVVVVAAIAQMTQEVTAFLEAERRRLWRDGEPEERPDQAGKLVLSEDREDRDQQRLFWMSAQESAFARVWDNDEDAIYDSL